MTRLAYHAGRWIPLAAAAAALEDRGYQFADGVYEVIKVLDGRPRDLERHLDRLERSLAELAIAMPTSRPALRAILREARRRNPLRRATLYLQVTRGVAPRNHPFPKDVRPVLTVVVRHARFPTPAERARGVAVCLLADQRWGRCDIKTTALLPNVLAREEAERRGCREAWLVRDGRITEGTASNAFIVDAEGRLRTHPEGPQILSGITRGVILELARAEGIPISLVPFSAEEAKAAREAFLTSTTSLLLPVTRIDDTRIGDGRPGPVTRRLAERYAAYLDEPDARVAA